jgi:hypothetical protein
MYYAATTTDPKISRPIYKADGTVEGYMTSGGFLRFPPPIKLTITILLKYC